jgi:hypothetical protein
VLSFLFPFLSHTTIHVPRIIVKNLPVCVPLVDLSIANTQHFIPPPLLLWTSQQAPTDLEVRHPRSHRAKLNRALGIHLLSTLLTHRLKGEWRGCKIRHLMGRSSDVFAMP